MADPNPTGRGPAVALTIPPNDKPFLRRVLTAARDGLREELDQFGDELGEPTSQLLREEAAYGQLLDSLDGDSVYGDRDLSRALAQLADSVDRENDYCRVVAEHGALRSMLDQLLRAKP